jgi:plasmid stabilization system protein ParE
VTLPLVWLPEAQADLKQAISWYEAIRPDLALRFAIAVDHTVDAISRNHSNSRSCTRVAGGLAFGVFHMAFSLTWTTKES